MIYKAHCTLAIVMLSACGLNTENFEKSDNRHPFVGCWQSEDGLGTESWEEDPSGWLFGYAVNRDENNQVKFFEQMRFDGKVLTVIGPNDDPTAFTLIKNGPDYIFENPNHDYPQRINYYPSKGRLDASISMLDGSNKVEFSKIACQS